MKSIFTLLLITISASAFAYDGGKLTITLPSSKNIQVMIDGRAYQVNNSNTIILNNIQPGSHRVAIYKNTRNGYGNQGNYGKNAQRDRRTNQGDVLYSSTIHVRSSYHVDVMVNRFGKALVDERVIANNRDQDEDWYDSGYEDGERDNSYRHAMNESEFNQLMQKIRSQWSGKLSKARDAVNSNYFSTNQVKQLLQIFPAENERLDLAKLSYSNVVDRQNFRQLYELFSYNSQAELDRYIKNIQYQ